jgi:hypothetical protein
MGPTEAQEGLACVLKLIGLANICLFPTPSSQSPHGGLRLEEQALRTTRFRVGKGHADQRSEAAT